MVDNSRTPIGHLKSEQNCTSSDVESSPRKQFTTLRSLNRKCSYDPNGLCIVVLHNLAREVCEPLQLVFDTSFRFGALPLCWLEALITPVFKKGVASSSSNYRPVSPMCASCRSFSRTFHICKVSGVHFFYWTGALNSMHYVAVDYINFATMLATFM